MTSIAENIQRVQATIAAACSRANRDPSQVRLVAVSKQQPAALVMEALESGVQHFGENRVEEAEGKIPTIHHTPPPIWHMIGHIQSRKVKEVVPLFQIIHSIDSLRLAEKVGRTAVEYGKTLDALVQINVSGEETKSGLDGVNWETNSAVRATLWRELEAINRIPGLHIVGLMTIAPIVETAEQARSIFSTLATLRDTLSESLDIALPELSMGMTDDYPVAIEEGATMVRIGRAIFGESNH